MTAPGLIAMLGKADAEFIPGWMPGYPQFYPYNVASNTDDGRRVALGDRVVPFLDKHPKE